MTGRLQEILVVETAGHGGLLHYAVQLADGLAASVPSVELLATRGHEFAHHRGPARPVLVLPTLVPSTRLPSSRWRHLLRRAGIAVRMCGAWARILVEVVRRRPDVVVTTMDSSHPPAAIGIIAMTLLPGGPRVVHVCHNAVPFNTGHGGLFRLGRSTRVLLGTVLRRADLVLVHGQRTADEFREVWGDGPRLAVVPHGDERLLAGEPVAPAAEHRVLFFGDWRKIKGLPVLMEAFDRLLERCPEARLTIAGSPAPADFDADLVRRWAAGHGHRVTVWDDYVPDAEVPRVLASARVVVTPYLVGFQSGVVHLAMTKGLPVVASAVGDLPTVVRDGETGRVVPPDDPEKLADALEDVLVPAGRAEAMGRAGLAEMRERHDWRVVGAAVRDAIYRASS
ncbi:glycosyltransferase family 4 protein [Actinomycetospora aeridis]|uniref:Glycosyltransferase family 4 protein n=1 Tax=Actinomycetospora aeridis TaxID=3129231 RepID=A0ABU8N6H6_9PSEU